MNVPQLQLERLSSWFRLLWVFLPHYSVFSKDVFQRDSLTSVKDTRYLLLGQSAERAQARFTPHTNTAAAAVISRKPPGSALPAHRNWTGRCESAAPATQPVLTSGHLVDGRSSGRNVLIDIQESTSEEEKYTSDDTEKNLIMKNLGKTRCSFYAYTALLTENYIKKYGYGLKLLQKSLS